MKYFAPSISSWIPLLGFGGYSPGGGDIYISRGKTALSSGNQLSLREYHTGKNG
ncbi:hypothetical protein ACE4RR_05395 [Alteribacillus sp. HJP-4]